MNNIYYKFTFVNNKASKIRLTSFEHSNITSKARELKIFKRKHLEIFYFTAEDFLFALQNEWKRFEW